ncbi:MAG: cardiolipin synthase [Nannocystis sp.]|nr:cardiolipin synthase [Nannocystis sp.]MBA3544942.1 cardiolipin synthase [Nannocystis sp.]
MPDLYPERWLFELMMLLYVIAVTGFVVLERRRPVSTMAWLLALIFVPGFGLAAYLVFGRYRVGRRRRLRARRAVNPTAATSQLMSFETSMNELDEPLRGLVRLALNVSDAPLRRASSATLLAQPQAAYLAMEEAMRAAQRSILLEYYIWRSDEVGNRWIDLLCEKARAGVRVRLLIDDFGTLRSAPLLFQRLRAAGGEVLVYGPMRLRLRWPGRINFRNHRKIIVIDGTIGFTGGLNVGDEYLGRGPERRLWSDLHLRLTGDAVLGLHAIFLEDWLAATGETIDLNPDDPRIEREILAELFDREPAGSTGPLVQIIPSGPDLAPGLGIAAQFVAAIATATERCWIATPYFVPDDALNLALKTAALRGVDVRVLVPLPRNNDSKLVSLAARSYYDECLEAGCRIYEYLPGMLHAKYLLVDHTVAAIGSANMDVRSFYINYEVTAMLYDRGVTEQTAEVFRGQLAHALEVRREMRRRLPLAQRLGEAFARMLSPLL